MKKNIVRIVVMVMLLALVMPAAVFAQGATALKTKPLVIQTDFGLKDGAVSAMYGVALGVNPDLRIYDLTHEIPAYNIWEGAYRLFQTCPYWPVGTVFVSVVDPGVGTDRKSIVLKTKTGHYFVTPDNGTLTLISESMGIAEVREIDEKVNRLPGSGESYTFHGRDVYAYVGARLASGAITYAQVGPVLKGDILRIPYTKATLKDMTASGNIPVLDIQYGNVWTNIGAKVLEPLKLKAGDMLAAEIFKEGVSVYKGNIPFANSFGDVPEGKPLAYFNSLMELSFALNMDSFSGVNQVFSGPEWTVNVKRATP